MADADIKTVIYRHQFYHDGYRKIVTLLLLSLLFNFSLGGMLFYLYANPPKPKYFPTSINGRITPLIPIDTPNQSDPAVLQWANQAVVAAFSYNFINYRNELQASSEFFTAKGWRDFMRALQSSNNLEAVREKKLIVSAVATGAPVILQKGTVQGRYAWQIQMPMLISYQSSTEYSQQRVSVTMLVRRVHTLNAPRGIGIEQLVVAPMSHRDRGA